MQICTSFLSRELSGASRMQAIGHQVVGSKDRSHEDVKLMYDRFFSGKAVNIKRTLKKVFGPVKTKLILSQIFLVCFFIGPPRTMTCVNNVVVHIISCIGDIWQCEDDVGRIPFKFSNGS